MMKEAFAPERVESAAIGAKLSAAISAGASDAIGTAASSGEIFDATAISLTDSSDEPDCVVATPMIATTAAAAASAPIYTPNFRDFT